MGRAGDLFQQFARLALRFGALGRIAVPGLGCEEIIEYKVQVDIPGPAIALVEGQLDAIAGIDAGEQESIQRGEQVPAKDTRVLHDRIEITQSGSAAAHHEIN